MTTQTLAANYNENLTIIDFFDCLAKVCEYFWSYYY